MTPKRHQMAEKRTINLDRVIIPPSLASLANVRPLPLFQGMPEIDWDHRLFGSINIWHGLTLDDAQVLNVGQAWLTSVVEGTVSTQTAINGLKLALSLKSMKPGNQDYLISQQARGAADHAGVKARVDVPPIDNFSTTPFATRIQQAIFGPEIVPGGNDSEQQRRFSYCFIAAYLMRLVVKSPENVVSGIKNMKARFGTFYGPTRTVTRFTITNRIATAYKYALNSEELIGATFSHAIAFTHQERLGNMNQKEEGVIAYLGTLPFSYTGMHSYNLIMELKYFTNLDLGRLLALFYCNVTSPAILKITEIVNNYERTVENPDRNITFRYCTMWGPQYFATVRSKRSSHLLYTVACAWKALLGQGKPGADPERIAATARFSEDMRRTLEKAGTIIGNTLKGKMLEVHPSIGFDKEDEDQMI